ncbi:hypothetical protein KO353_09650 [Elioraea tepida]|jgi:hypothetical protein|uniref:Uncharacterized protein n=1 Tax=Elioraea tepida TaxID=2843330 RepID=A0A975YIN4_9PROT|nr:hypothetical protein [Elioraea tepida]QXM23587.1 hypothetical protein KO353_09650 [Elioraea tepida]
MAVEESRRILFGLAALREAVGAHLVEIAPGLVPRGAAIGDLVVLPQSLSLRLLLAVPGSSERTEAEMTATQIAALLIRRCRALRIPLPRRGRKGLEASPEGIAIVVEMVHETAGVAQSRPLRLCA